MKLDKALVDYLTDLARIACSEKEREDLLKDLSQILDYVEMLNEVDTKDVPTCDFVSQSMHKMPLAKDIPNNSLPPDEFLQNSPKAIARMISVPTVIKKEE